MTDSEFSDDELSPKRRRLLQSLGAFGVAGATGLAGCTGGGGDSSDTPTSGSEGTPTPTTGMQSDSMSISQTKSPITFDPAKANDVPSLQVVQRIHETLYTFGKETGIQPKIAKSEPEISKEGTRWVVELREDATFQNGDPITATDVKYSYNAPMKEETENGSEFNMVDSITVVDEKTVQFDLKYAYAPFPTKLAWQIYPKSVRESDKQAFAKSNPVGAGPYKFVDWKQGEYVKLSRWEDYWDTKPNVKELELVPVKEPTTRVTTLKNGTHDAIQGVPPKLYSTVKSMQNASLKEENALGYYYLAFNCNEGPTSDPKVREAVDYTFSMQEAVRNYIQPAGNRLYAPFPQSISTEWEFPVDDWKEIPHNKDIEKAKQLFEEAGIPKDYSWKIIVPPDKKREQIGISVGNGLKAAGFSNVSVNRYEWGTFLDLYSTGKESDYNMYTLGWVDEFDPHQYLYFLFHESQEGGTNGTYYDKPEVMEQISKAGKITDHAQRKQLYTDAVTTILEDRAHLPAYNVKNSVGIQNDVKDFKVHTLSQLNPRMVSDYNNVYLDN